jgi:hypothetical protein
MADRSLASVMPVTYPENETAPPCFTKAQLTHVERRRRSIWPNLNGRSGGRLLGRSLLILTLGVLALLALHLLTLLLHRALLGTQLIHLVGRQDRVDLIAQRVSGLRVLRAAGRMLRCELIEGALNGLLLLLRQVQGRQPAHPMLILSLTGRALLALDGGWLRSDLCRGPNRQGESRNEGGQSSDLHATMIRSARRRSPERRIRDLQELADV